MARACGSYPQCHRFKSSRRYHTGEMRQHLSGNSLERGIRPVGQVVKTRPFHGCNMGSSPVRVTTSAARQGCRQYGGLAQLVRAPASHAGGHWFESSSLHHENTLIFNKSGCFYNFLRVFKVGEKSCTTKIRQFFEKHRKKQRKGEPLRLSPFCFCGRPGSQESFTKRLRAGVVIYLCEHLQVAVPQQTRYHVGVDALRDPKSGSGMAQLVG